jgi:hypothetical protein
MMGVVEQDCVFIDVYDAGVLRRPSERFRFECPQIVE